MRHVKGRPRTAVALPSDATGSRGRNIAPNARPAGAPASLGAVTTRAVVERMARTYGLLEAAALSSLGVALAGCLVLMAAIGLALSATWPAISADAGTALSTARAAVNGDHQWIDILAPPAQVAVYAPFVIIGRPEFATAVPALFGALLLVLVAVTAWRITGMAWAGAVTGLFLLSSPEYWQRASQLPAYQQFVFFGYLGLALTAVALHRRRRSSAFAIAGGAALALSAYSFTIGLLFLPATLLLALVWKGRWKPALVSLSTAAVLLLPFAVWHIAVAGVRKAFYYPHSFVLVKYWEDFQGFWNRPDYDVPGYVSRALPDMLLGAAPIWLWLLGAAGLLVIGKAHGARVSVTIAAAMVTVLIPHVVMEVLYPRYVYPLVPGVALAAGVGLALALRSVARYRAGRHLSVLATAAIAFLAVFIASTVISTHLDDVRTARADSRYADLRAVASKVDDHRALLARDSHLQVLLPHNQVYSALFFSEDEYLDYVLWQDEGRVRRLLAGRDIGWVVLRNNVHRWERDSNLWAIAASGYPPRHYICLPQSAGLSKVYGGYFFTLYKVDQDWLRSDSVAASCAVPPEERWSRPGAWRRGPAGPVDGDFRLQSP